MTNKLLDSKIKEFTDEIVEEIIVECGSEPDGEKLWIKTSDELEKIIKPILSTALSTAQEEAVREIEKEYIERKPLRPYPSAEERQDDHCRAEYNSGLRKAKMVVEQLAHLTKLSKEKKI